MLSCRAKSTQKGAIFEKLLTFKVGSPLKMTVLAGELHYTNR